MSRDVVVFSLEAWDGVWRRNQYLVDGLLRDDPGARVLFVEPARDIAHDVLSRRAPHPGAGLRRADGYGGRLHLLQPTKVMPRQAGPLADTLLRRALHRAIRRVGLIDPVRWVNDPSWAGEIARHDGAALYDMTDDWLASDQPARVLGRIRSNEAILFDRCQTIVVCSEGLRHSRSSVRSDLVLIPNAVDVARYRRPTTRPPDLPSGRVALYAGTLHEDRIDVDLLERTAAALSARGGTVVLLGPNALGHASRERLRVADGIVELGPRPHESVPAYLQHADVLIVPHTVNDFTASLDPIKLYEYLAVGRRVVATPVAGFRDLAGAPGIEIAEGSGFVDGVLDPEIMEGVVHDGVADWADRIRDFRSVIDRMDRMTAPSGSRGRSRGAAGAG